MPKDSRLPASICLAFQKCQNYGTESRLMAARGRKYD